MNYRYCPQCATPLEWLPAMEDGGAKERLRCTGCGWTHWNNPTPVLAAQGSVVLKSRVETSRSIVGSTDWTLCAAGVGGALLVTQPV